MSDKIPAQTFKRLPQYYAYLKRLDEQGLESISSPVMAKAMRQSDIQVRKDLATVSEAGGKPRTGYAIRELLDSIALALGIDRTRDAVLVGAGQLGRALMGYSGFLEYGLRIVAGFDCDPNGQGVTRNNKRVLPMEQLSGYCRKNAIRIGIITVPPDAAQTVCDTLVAAGVQAIWNFSHIQLSAPDEVWIQNENMAVSLALLSQHLDEQTDKKQEVTP